MTDEERMQEIDEEVLQLRALINRTQDYLATIKARKDEMEDQAARIIETQYGLTRGMVLSINREFLDFEHARSNNALFWRSDVVNFECAQKNLDGDWRGAVSTGCQLVGGIPLEMIQSMRAAYLATQGNTP